MTLPTQRTAVVTGAGGPAGIGRVTARVLAEHGERPDAVRPLPIAYRGEPVGRLLLPRNGVRAALPEGLLRDMITDGVIAAVRELGADVGMDEIAAHIGVSKTVLYRYFADMDAIVAAVNQEVGARDARVTGGHKLRLVRPIAGAAAAVALVVGGMTAVSYGAQPGDPLWKVKEVVFSDQASSTVANSDATADLDQAEQLIANGNVAEAKTYLDRASARVGDVKDDAARQELLARWEKLKAELQKKAAPAPAETSTSSAAATTSSSAPGTPPGGLASSS